MKLSYKRLLNLFIITLTMGLSACGGGSDERPVTPPPPPPPPVEVDYQAIIDRTISSEIPGVILLVETPKKKFSGSAGVSDRESQLPMKVSDVMPTASGGKKMIALLAVQLAEEGLLNLDDTLSTWIDNDILMQIEHSELITLRQLLSHTSGISNFSDVNDGNAYLELLMAEPEVLKTDIDFLSLAYNQPASFLPGKGFEYSNSGFALVGLILDKVLGMHHSVEMRNRFFGPLNMTSTYYRGAEASQGDFISGYVTTENGEAINSKPFLTHVSQANAPVVSSVEDMAVFLKALVTDDSFVSDSVRNEMFGEDNLIIQGANEKSGLGIYVATVNGNTVYAHAGLTYGYYSQSLYIKEADTSIVVFFNCGKAGVNQCITGLDNLVQLVLSKNITQ